MNLNKIREILSLPFPDEHLEQLVVDELARDERVIPNMLRILDSERRQKKEVFLEANSLLSLAFVGLEERKMNKGGFMQERIKAFYRKWRGTVGPTLVFSIEEEPPPGG